MLRSLLLVLDDTPGAGVARDIALALARQTGAALTAVAVLDRPHTADAVEAAPIGGGAFLARRNAALAAQAEAEAAAAITHCLSAAGDLPIAIERLGEAPEPALLAAAAAHDLIVIGRDCTLGREQTEAGLAPAIEALLREGGRPLLICPATAPANSGPVLIGYDDSLPARRALHAFALLGLIPDAPVRLLTAASDPDEVRPLATAGAALLRQHGRSVEAFALEGDPVALLLAEAATHHARLLVMGAYGHGGLRAWLRGTATSRLLREAPCPILAAG